MDIFKVRSELSKGKSIYDLNLRVVDYSRVSTSLEEQASSLKNQGDFYKKLIEETPNWTHVNSYVDDGITGLSTRGRDDFKKMIEDGLNGMFDMIITKEVTRFARNTLDSIFYTRELLKNGVAVYFESDNINTIDPDSEFKLTIMASLAQEESRKTSQRVRWAKRKLIENGKIFIPPNMHGYRLVDDKVEVIEDEAIMIRKIFELYLKGYGFRRIGKELHKLGYENSNGNPYNYTTLKKILTNPRYKGYFTGAITEKESYMSTKVIYKDPSEWVMYPAPDKIPPIVTEEVWDKANALLKKKSDKLALKNADSYQNRYKYSGKLFCKEHNTPFHRTMYRYIKAEDRELYQCKVYREQGRKACSTPILYTTELDAILGNIFKVFFSQKDDLIDTLMKLISKYLQEEDFTKDISRTINQMDKINSRKDKLLDLAVNDLITRDEFKQRNDEFNASIEILEQELKRYEDLRTAKRSSVDQLNLMKEFLNKSFDFDKEVPNEIINNFVDSIYVEAGEVENLIKLEINLKTGQEIPVYYRKDLSLSLAMHVDRDKMMFSLPRIKNNKKAPNIMVEVSEVNLNIAI